MAILPTDIRLIQAADQTETATGGGYMGATEVVGGVENNLLPDISRMDRAYSRLHFKKVYLHARSANNDTYLGAHTALTAISADPKVYEFLIPADGDEDRRPDAIARVEGFHITGLEAGTVKYDRAAGLTQFVTEQIDISYSGNLLLEFEAGVFEVVDVISVTGSGTDKTVTINEPLQHAIPAGAQIFYATRDPAWRAYGAAHPSAPAAAGALSIIVDEIDQGLISSSEGSRTITGEGAWIAVDEVYPMPRQWESGGLEYLWSPSLKSVTWYAPIWGLAPGSFSCYVYFHSSFHIHFKDDGNGLVVLDDSQSNNTQGRGVSGSIDYATGRFTLTLTSAPNISGRVDWCRARKTPRIPAIIATDSVTATDTSVYSGSLSPSSVVPGSVTIRFRVNLGWHTVYDDGAGGFVGAGSGTIDYDTGGYVVEFNQRTTVGSKVILRWASSHYTGAGLVEAESLGAGDGLQTEFTLANPPDAGSVAVRFTDGGVERDLWDDGVGYLRLARNIQNGGAAIWASINYETGIISFFATPDDTTAITATEYTRQSAPPAAVYHFKTACTDVDENSVSFNLYDVDGAIYTITDDGLGTLTGTDVTGTIDYASGAVEIACGFRPQEGTLSLNYSAGAAIKPDSSIIGLNVSALPTSGKVPVFYENGLVLIKEGATEELVLVTSIDSASRTLTLAATLANSYTTGAVVSSVMPLGDLTAAKGVDFTQDTWDGVTWGDVQSGSSSTGAYDFVNHPLALRNDGCVTDRWAVKFTSESDFTLYSERLGLVASGNTATALSPTNPNTSAPYFTLAAAGWGGTWAYGHILRFNTTDAAAPFWVVRSIHAGASGAATDSITIALRGDEDA